MWLSAVKDNAYHFNSAGTEDLFWGSDGAREGISSTSTSEIPILAVGWFFSEFLRESIGKVVKWSTEIECGILARLFD